MVEIVIVLPALLACITLLMQVAMWGLSAHAVSMAVAEGGATARAEFQGAGAAASVVRHDLAVLAGPLASDPTVSVRLLPGDFVQVQAKARVPTIFPGLHPTVSATSTGPLQQFRASG